MGRISIRVAPARIGAGIVVAAGILYAGVYGVRAAVEEGAPAPSCPAPAVAGENVAAVFGRPAGYAATARLVQAARHYGFRGARYRLDACGRLEVVVTGIPDLKSGHDIQREARSVGLRATLERDR